jgi:hypothetical protein
MYKNLHQRFPPQTIWQQKKQSSVPPLPTKLQKLTKNSHELISLLPKITVAYFKNWTYLCRQPTAPTTDAL